jgi:threonine 3-dehydrogenase
MCHLMYLCQARGNFGFRSGAIRMYSSLVQPRAILITGALGQLGTALVPFLLKKDPNTKIIATDVKQHKGEIPLDSKNGNVKFRYADVLNRTSLEDIVVSENVGTIVHFSALLSAIGELYPQKAMDLGLISVHHVLEIAKMHNCRVFIPSTIGAFGPTTPKQNTPDLTIMRPTTIYGITKLHMELMGEYYYTRYGVDFRSVRLPGILSVDIPPGGGTTDYAIHMLQTGANSRASTPTKYVSFLSENTRLPMMHIRDAMQGLYQMIVDVPSNQLKQRVYNMGAMDFTPLELATLIQKQAPHFQVTYEPDRRQAIADTWPASLDDSNARKDWGWSPQHSLESLVSEAFSLSKAKL